MRKEKGITLVSLVVTIIILIILAGVSINLILGKNGIITIAKQAKENTELAKIEEETALNELYMQIETEGGISGDISYDAIAKLTEFKTAIANYIEEAGGVKPETTANATTFGESIKGILKEVTKDATATVNDIAEGKTAWVNGEKITGVASFSENKFIFATTDIVNAGHNISVFYPFEESNNNSYTIKESGTYNCYLITTSLYAGMGASTQVYVNGQKQIQANQTSATAFSDYNGTLTLNEGDVITITIGSETHKDEYTLTSFCVFWKE